MTIEDVRESIRRIAESADDDESAHSMEDGLHRSVLKAIADDTAEDPRGMARLALTTEDISFARWCA